MSKPTISRDGALSGEIIPPPKTQNALVPPKPPDPPARSDWGDDRGRRDGGRKGPVFGAITPLLSQEFVEEFLAREAPGCGYVDWSEDQRVVRIRTRKPIPDHLKDKLRETYWSGREVEFLVTG